MTASVVGMMCMAMAMVVVWTVVDMSMMPMPVGMIHSGSLGGVYDEKNTAGVETLYKALGSQRNVFEVMIGGPYSDDVEVEVLRLGESVRRLRCEQVTDDSGHLGSGNTSISGALVESGDHVRGDVNASSGGYIRTEGLSMGLIGWIGKENRKESYAGNQTGATGIIKKPNFFSLFNSSVEFRFCPVDTNPTEVFANSVGDLSDGLDSPWSVIIRICQATIADFSDEAVFNKSPYSKNFRFASARAIVIVARSLAEAVRNFETEKMPKSDKEIYLFERLMIIESIGPKFSLISRGISIGESPRSSLLFRRHFEGTLRLVVRFGYRIEYL